jgi:ribosome maturation factor RimP
MRRHPVVERLWEELEKTVVSLGYELLQVTYGGPLASLTLTVYLDRPGGVTVEDCAGVAEQLSVLLDTLDPIPGQYSLVVSSPGLDRPLGRDEDFTKYAGQRVAVRYQSAAGKARRLRGRLAGVREEQVILELESGVQEISLDQITAANLEYDWDGTGDGESAE